MSYGSFFKIILVLTIVLTVCIGILKPKMHTSVMIQNSEYAMETPDIKTMDNIQATAVVSTEQAKNTVKKTDTVKVTNDSVKNIDNTVKNTINTMPVNHIKSTTNTVSQKSVATETKPIIKEVKPVVKKEQTAVKPVKSVVKTEIQMEEEIVWNKWRSDIQNQLMRDVQLPIIPQGTVFKFQFDVDKYGRVTNVKTWSLTSSFTPYAIQYIAPIIKSYQGRELLKFPAGSNRTATTVEGGWKIGKVSKYSTPNNYNDIEKVIK